MHSCMYCTRPDSSTLYPDKTGYILTSVVGYSTCSSLSLTNNTTLAPWASCEHHVSIMWASCEHHVSVTGKAIYSFLNASHDVQKFDCLIGWMLESLCSWHWGWNCSIPAPLHALLTMQCWHLWHNYCEPGFCWQLLSYYGQPIICT